MITLSSTKTDTETIAERRASIMPQYKVLLHNDDVNTMEHVVMALMQVFKYDQSICETIMLKAHNESVALCTVEPFEQAELHRDQLISFSLISTIEPE